MAVRIGLDNFYYTPITTDTATDTTYGTAVRIMNITEATMNPNSTIETFFADDGPAEVFSQIGEIELSISVGELPPKDYAFLLGATYANGVVEYETTATAPDVAVSFRSQKSNGEYKYLCVYKGKFSVPEENFQTKADGVNFQPQTIMFKGVQRKSDGKVYRTIDSDDATLPSGVTKTTLLTDFFASPDYAPVVIP